MLSVMTSCASQPDIRPVTDPAKRYTGKGYSALPPQGQEWYIQGHGPYAVHFGKRPVERNHTFVAVVEVMEPEARKVDLAAEFTKATEHLLNETLDGGRFRLISLKVVPYGSQKNYCSQYDFVQEERSNPMAPGVVLEITAHGFVCLDISSKFMIRADYSERKTKEMESILDDALKQDVEEFLKNVIVTPLSDS
jgi:hypothetical protein